MILNTDEINLITAALRSTAMNYEQIAKAASAKFDLLEAQRCAVFAGACAALADRIEQDAKPRAGGGRIIRPK